MKSFQMTVLALALAVAGAAGAETVTFPASFFTARAHQLVQKHRDVVEAAVANSAYGQAMLARYDSGELGPVDTAEMWWVHGYGDDRSLWLVDAQFVQGHFRTEGAHREQDEQHRGTEPAFMAMDVLTEEVVVVPEPGTWAMLLAGVAVVGLAARGRRGA
jgi:hypothetical protein